MDRQSPLDILRQVASGALDPRQAQERLAEGRRADLGFATVDLDRPRRVGAPEFIYCERKTVEQIVAIARTLDEAGHNILCTRVSPQTAHQARRQLEGLEYRERANALVKVNKPVEPRGLVAIACAGTSDLDVAEEAALTAEVMGARVESFNDVGVAGLHRLLARMDEIRQADAIVVVAGMDGALPSVLAGLAAAPVIAVPTSVGYGASFQGLAAMLTMLNSCSPGVSVVNIDNGFGAGYQAALIARAAGKHRGPDVEAASLRAAKEDSGNEFDAFAEAVSETSADGAAAPAGA